MRVVGALAAAIGLAACLESPPGGDGPVPEPDAARPIPCLELEDDFEGAILDQGIWDPVDDAGTTYEVGSGSLTLEAAPTAEWGYIDVHTRAATPLSGFTVTAEVAIRITGQGDAALTVSTPSGYIGVYADSGLIGIASDYGGFAMICDEGCDLYDAEMHRFWRIREEGDLLHFETSPDDSAFTPLVGPQPAPHGDHTISLWAECGAGNEVETEVYRVYTACDG